MQYEARGISSDMSFLEMLDVVNEDLIKKGDEPIAFDSDCREGICGMCGQVVNGVPHGPMKKTTICQLHMRHFKDGDSIYIEPFRARAFPVIKDLIVDRSAFDKIIQAGVYFSPYQRRAGRQHHPHPQAGRGQGHGRGRVHRLRGLRRGVPERSAMLFTAAKVSHLASLPQGRTEAARRVCVMTEEMLKEGFGNCSNHYECQAVCL